MTLSGWQPPGQTSPCGSEEVGQPAWSCPGQPAQPCNSDQKWCLPSPPLALSASLFCSDSYGTATGVLMEGQPGSPSSSLTLCVPFRTWRKHHTALCVPQGWGEIKRTSMCSGSVEPHIILSPGVCHSTHSSPCPRSLRLQREITQGNVESLISSCCPGSSRLMATGIMAKDFLGQR